MKRIWEPEAYSPGPLARCWWAETVETPDWPVMDGDRSTDVAVIGGGFTGLNAALHLTRGGADVTLLEAETPFFGATGRNGGFCCLGGSKASSAALDRRFGPDGRLEWHRAQVAAVDYVADLFETHAIEADRHSEGETLLAHRPKDRAKLEEEAREARDDYGVEPRMIAREDLAAHGLSGPFHGAVTVPIGFALNPRKYAAALARAAQEAGATLHARTPVTAISGDGPYRLATPGGTLTAKRLVVATNGYSSEDLPPWMAGRYLPVQSSILVTRPLTEDERQAQGWTSLQMCFDTRTLLHYFRLMPDGRMLFGMRGGLSATPRAEAGIRRRIRADFEAMFPAWARVETPHYWSGLVCLARDLMPYAGPIPGMEGAFAGFAYHGNGVSMGSWTGALLADFALGRDTSRRPRAMSGVPRRFPLGRHRRALLYPVYAGYALGDL